MENGMVLSMSAWYSKETYPLRGSQTGMSWLDGTNNWGKDIKAGPCDTTTSDVIMTTIVFIFISFTSITISCKF